MGKVTIIGSYIVALVMDMDRIPLEGETLIGRNYHTTHGGKGSNMAAGVARLGGSATFFGKIGRDAFGEEFVRLLAKEKVDSSGVLHSSMLPTAVGFILSSATGTNCIAVDLAACGDFHPADIVANAALIEGADVVLAPLEIPLATALAGARHAFAAGKLTILNPAPAADLRGQDLSSIFALTPNETEGRICLGMKPDDAIDDAEVVRRLLKLGPKNIMLTLGAQGALWGSSDGKMTRIPALMVNVVDTCGAGDAFNAGLAVGLSEGLTVLDSIVLGVTTASLSTRIRETIESYPGRAEVEARMSEVKRGISF